MPLNYNYGKVKVKTWEADGTFDKDGEPLGRKPEVLESLIWITMSVGMNSITEKNWIDFYTRMKLLGVDRNLLRKDKDGNYTVPISAEEVKDHIGLVTNADTLTKAEFFKRVYKSVYNETERQSVFDMDKTKGK
tara:strand:+ start:54 stop:455 length:402 start_codon:yes stop_codon:yes gene_type:complete